MAFLRDAEMRWLFMEVMILTCFGLLMTSYSGEKGVREGVG
jgi:hypothetical protein